MNTHVRFTNTNFANLDELLEIQPVDPTTGQNKQTGLPVDMDIEPATEATPCFVQDQGQTTYNLPFQNLDPYVLDGKDTLPSGELNQTPWSYFEAHRDILFGTDDIQVNFFLETGDYMFRTQDGTLDIHGLYEERLTETRYINDGWTPVEHRTSLEYNFDGCFYDTQFRQLQISLDTAVATTIQKEAFDDQGNQILTGYRHQQELSVDGHAHDYGIANFAMEFALIVDIQLVGDQYYEMTVSVVFEGYIDYWNGAQKQFFFEEEIPFQFKSLDEIELGQLPQGFYDKIGQFADGMGEAWDAFGTFNDHLEAVLLKLREDGQYQAWDEIGQGLQNPFDFNLPNTDPFA